MTTTDMVGHHDDIVYHQIQRNGNPCQRIKLHLHPQCVIEDESNGQVNGQAGDYQEQVA